MSGQALPPGVTVFCDPTLAPAIRALDGLSGIPVSALSAPAPLMLAQINRHTRNDVLFTLSQAMDQAEGQSLVRPETRVDGFFNSLVIAAAGAVPPDLSGARVAVTDATIVSGLDGRAILAANGLRPAAILGTASTADAVFMVLTGAADAALVYRTDVMATPELAVITTLAADKSLTSYAAAVNAKAVSPNAGRFVGLLREAAGKLAAAGIQSAA